MRTTVDAILREPKGRNPNGVECDSCGKTVNLDRQHYMQDLRTLEAEGWSIGADGNGPHKCPDCAVKPIQPD